jgi:hypothetical protein
VTFQSVPHIYEKKEGFGAGSGLGSGSILPDRDPDFQNTCGTGSDSGSRSPTMNGRIIFSFCFPGSYPTTKKRKGKRKKFLSLKKWKGLYF